ncbi:hypothetical protein [Blautia obeum]|uniref:hypothetical protein n=1 Tax=Blautia obeum TaxID=40520 RepID=UPI003028E871|nr:hypothetical protein [Lachnospiraceae bacterium]
MKNIRFPLEMAGGKMVRELEEFQEYFDLEKAIEYFSNGKLQRWLESTYNDDILEEIEKMDGKEPDFVRKFTDALGVDEKSDSIDVNQIMQDAVIREKLKAYVSEEKINTLLSFTADTQEIMELLIHKGSKKIYLLEGEYKIPKNIFGIYFEGIGKVRVQIEEKDQSKYQKQRLYFINIIPSDKESKELMDRNVIENCMMELLDVLEIQIERMVENV